MERTKEGITLKGGSGYGHQGWVIGQVVENPKGVDPQYLTVVTVSQRHYSIDGRSFGVGDDSGYVYYATTRQATEKEAEPFRAKLAIAAAKKEAAKMLAALGEHIRAIGERPAGHHTPAGEIIRIERRTAYSGGSWIVAGQKYIWYVLDNGGDGDNWELNNVLTSGAGAIGWRVPTTKEMNAICIAAAKAAVRKV